MAVTHSFITTHALDTRVGKPASNIPVAIYKAENTDGDRRLDNQQANFHESTVVWHKMATGVTDANGRIIQWDSEEPMQRITGMYRIEFETWAYFQSQQVPYFYPRVIIDFFVEDAQQHFHVPLLISPFGFSTYRGS